MLAGWLAFFARETSPTFPLTSTRCVCTSYAVRRQIYTVNQHLSLPSLWPARTHDNGDDDPRWGWATGPRMESSRPTLPRQYTPLTKGGSISTNPVETTPLYLGAVLLARESETEHRCPRSCGARRHEAEKIYGPASSPAR